MIAKVVIPRGEDGIFNTYSIECDRVNYRETKDSWQVWLVKNDNVVADFKVNMKDKPERDINIYLIENGKTADRLPKR